jgi:hypothetical protein
LDDDDDDDGVAVLLLATFDDGATGGVYGDDEDLALDAVLLVFVDQYSTNHRNMASCSISS